MELDGLRTLIAQHAISTNVLVGLGLAMKAKVDGEPLEGEIAERVADIVEHLDATEAIGQHAAAQLLPLLASIRSDVYFGTKALSEMTPAHGWGPAEPHLLQSFGDVSAGFPSLFARMLLPQLPGLAAALEAPGSKFLDVGVGVGGLSLAMLRRWPQLSIVGIDPLETALSLAQSNVRGIGLEQRLELRQGFGGDLQDRDAFDLAFVPSAFIPKSQLGAVLRRVALALKPDGWALVAVVNPGDDPLQSRVTKFRTALWGGTTAKTGELLDLLRGEGLGDSRLLPGPTASPIIFLAGRRPVADLGVESGK